MKEISTKNITLVILIILMSISVSGQNKTRWPNGMPDDPNYFPISVWLQEPSDAAAYKEAGINLYIGLWQGPTENQLQTLRSAGMPVMCKLNEVGEDHLDDTLIVAWLQQGEPDNAQALPEGGYGPCVDPDTIIAEYNRIKSIDATRPVRLGLGQGVRNYDWGGRGSCTGDTAMYREYIKGCDIVNFDIYPIYSDNGYPLIWVGEGVDNLRRWSNYEKPVTVWIESTAGKTGKKATPIQVKAEVWMALTHGALSFGYFAHTWYPSFNSNALLDDEEMITAVAAINKQVKDLAPILNSPTIENAVNVVTTPMGGVRAMVKSYEDTLYIFAVNEKAYGTSSTTFTINGEVLSNSAEVIDEDRELMITDNSFTDSFENYEVHLYKIGGVTVGVNQSHVDQPNTFSLSQNYPNPFNPETVINFQIPYVSDINISIYNSLGQKIITIIDARVIAGNYTVTWDGLNQFGQNVSSGMYFYKISADGVNGFTETKKMILLR